MKNFLLGLALVVLASVPATAQIAISQLPTAAVPLQGNEVVAGIQNGQTVQIPETAFGIQGPASAVSGHVATFSGTTGKLIQDSGVSTGPYTGAGLGQLPGTSTNDSASAGKIGEYITATNAFPGTSLTTGTPLDVTSISLTAGDWDVVGTVGFSPNGATTATSYIGWISATSATLPGAPNGGAFFNLNFPFSAPHSLVMPTGKIRISLSATTTIYLSAQATFAVNTNSAYGFIGARRVR